MIIETYNNKVNIITYLIIAIIFEVILIFLGIILNSSIYYGWVILLFVAIDMLFIIRWASKKSKNSHLIENELTETYISLEHVVYEYKNTYAHKMSEDELVLVNSEKDVLSLPESIIPKETLRPIMFVPKKIVTINYAYIKFKNKLDIKQFKGKFNSYQHQRVAKEMPIFTIQAFVKQTKNANLKTFTVATTTAVR